MKRILLLLTLFVTATALWAQVQLSATADKTDLALDDELTLTVQVSGVSGTMVMPQLPSLPAFNVYSREAAQTTVNGKTTLLFKYTMMPRFVGSTSIGPVTFKYGGKTYQTSPIAVRIYRNTPPTTAKQNAAASRSSATVSASAQAANDVAKLPPLERELATRAYAHTNEPFFIVAAVSNKTPYINEPFILAVRFYYSKAFYDAPYQNPTVSNLFMEEAGEAQGQQTIHSTIYRYEEKRYRLAGVSAGDASIGAASVSFRPGSSPLSVFDRFFGGAAVEPEQTVSSKPMKLAIRPLPTTGKPTSFYGAVGTGYAFSAKLDREQTEAGDAVTWSATVQGPGNLKTTSDLTFPTVDAASSYPAAPQAGYLPNTQNRSYKIFKTELVPTSSGTYTLPALQWSYFDPLTHTYRTLTSRPLTLTVTPSTRTEKQVNFTGTDTTGLGIQTFGEDIRYVLPAEDLPPSALSRLPAWKGLHALVFLWLAGCLFTACFGKRVSAKKQAFHTAKAQLKKATTYEHISDALAAYLLAKFQISTASLPLKDITAELAHKQVPTTQVETFAALWKELESARFAPLQGQTNTLSQFTARTEELLRQLEGSK